MKFCPNCGSKRDDKNICECGYNYETGENIIQTSSNNMKKII